MKFVMTQAVCSQGLALLEGKAEVWVADAPDPNTYRHQMQDAEAIIVRIGKLDREAIEHAPGLKVIGRTGVGYDSVDAQAATERGIPIVITPGANNRSVAEHAVAMILALSKNLLEGHVETRAGNFSAIRGAGKAFEVRGKRAGFIGLGAIGRETAHICRALGMAPFAYDPFLSKEQVEEAGCGYYADYRQLIRACDIISLHLPLVEGTRNMIARPELESMKREALLVNCARGGIVNEADLVWALENGVIAGAATDVFEEEPPAPDNPLLTAPNLLYSPHSAAQTREAVINMATMCVEGCLAVLGGEQWPLVANPDAYKHPRWAGGSAR